TRFSRDWSSDVCSSDLADRPGVGAEVRQRAGVELGLALAPAGQQRLAGGLEALVEAGEEGLGAVVEEIGHAPEIGQADRGRGRGRLQDGGHGGLQWMLRCSATVLSCRVFDKTVFPM